MLTAIERTAYQLSQGIRLGWYSAQSALTTRISERVKAPPELRAAMPTIGQLSEDRRALMRRDLANIEAGYYRLPHDMIDNPARILRRTLRYFADLREINHRLREQRTTELRTTELDRFPDYYRRSFHHQTDGYLSHHSAALYDHQVEVLFGGAADAMRRQALVPLYRFLRGRRIAETRLIDIACGTGQFLTFVKDNYPRLQVTALDLSPFYLDEAKRRLSAWSRIDFVEGRAEAMTFADESFDIATCIYLLHELPPDLHVTVAAEIARVLKPGGLLILVDSLQPGDRPEYDALLQYFPMAFHEPYFGGYLRRDLDALFAGPGLVPEGVDLAYLSKVVVYRKPGSEPQEAAEGGRRSRRGSAAQPARRRPQNVRRNAGTTRVVRGGAVEG